MSHTTLGRPPSKTNYIEICYKDKYYVVAQKDDFVFVIDKEDFEKVKLRSWYKLSSGYIASSMVVNGVKKQLLLHRYVLNRLDFPGKGATESVDHINRNPLDNRKENLRIVSQTEQNINQSKKPRTIVQLPDNCGIQPDDIPRHIWYVKPNGLHGDRFAIEFKTENIVWKSTSSKKITLQEKLKQAKDKLAEFYTQYPYLNPNDTQLTQINQTLTDSFNSILQLSY